MIILSESLQSQIFPSRTSCASNMVIKYPSSLILAVKKAGHSISDQCVIYEQEATTSSDGFSD